MRIRFDKPLKYVNTMLLIGLRMTAWRRITRHGLGRPARRLGARTRAESPVRGVGLGHARARRRRYRRLPRRTAQLVPDGADPVPAGRWPARAAAAGTSHAGRCPRRGLTAPAPHGGKAAGRPGPARDSPAPGRPARTPAGRPR